MTAFSQPLEGFYRGEKIYDMEIATIEVLKKCIDGYVKGDENEKEDLTYMGSFEGWSRFHYQVRIENEETDWTEQKHFRVQNLRFEVGGSKEMVGNGYFYPVTKIIEDQRLIVLRDISIKIEELDSEQKPLETMD